MPLSTWNVLEAVSTIFSCRLVMKRSTMETIEHTSSNARQTKILFEMVPAV